MPGAQELFAVDEADEVFANGKLNGHKNGNHFETDNDDEELIGKVHLLENKIKEQGSEIHLLKSALADALARLSCLEENVSCLKDKPKEKATKQRSLSGSTRDISGSTQNISNPRTIQRSTTPSARTRSKSELPTPTKSTEDTKIQNKQVKARTSNPSPTKQPTSPTKKSTSTRKKSTSESSVIPYSHQPKKSITDDGKPKIILASRKPSASSKKKKRHSRSNSSGNNSTDSDSSPKDDSTKFNIRGRGLIFYTPTTYEERKDDGAPPEENLKLTFVYGYRGKDSRDNLFMLPSEEVLYNMAGVLVLYDINTKTQRHFTGHTDDVKCLALHPDQNTVASGQVAGHGEEGKPHILIWSATSLDTLASFGHGVFERGLCAIEFSKQDGKYLVAIDESNEHVISMWEWEKQVKMTETKVSKESVFNVKWSNKDPYSFATYGKSHLVFWTYEPEQKCLSKRAAIYQNIDKPRFVLALVYTEDGNILTGDSNGYILLFKEGNNRIHAASKTVQKGGVFALALIKDDKIISCGKDGQCCMWNMDLEKLEDLGKIDDHYGPARCILPTTDDSFIIGTTKNCILKYHDNWQHQDVFMQGHADEMWGLSVHPSQQIFATCSLEHTVCIWDGETLQNLWTYQVDDSPQCIGMHPSLPLVLVGSKSGTISILNYETKEELITLPVARDCIDEIKMSPDAKHFAAASRDTNIYLFSWPNDITSFKKPKILSGHSSRVHHLDWSSDSEFLQSNSQDYELLFWHTESGSQVLSPNALRDVDWETWTCPLGFPVTGIWPEGADGTDINTCCRSYSKQLVATGDDFGEVKLFRYPSAKLKAESNVGRGHSSHVTNVRFLKDDTSLITVGGNDCSIMQWKLVKEEKKNGFI